MGNRLNLSAVLSTLLFLSLSIALDQITDALRHYAGRTFNFQPALLGQLAALLVFSAMLLIFIHALRRWDQPTRPVAILQLVLSGLLILNFLLGFVFNLDVYFGLMPQGLRRAFTEWLTPGSYSATATVLMFWMGLWGPLKKVRKTKTP